jgi:hypothetical protein
MHSLPTPSRLRTSGLLAIVALVLSGGPWTGRAAQAAASPLRCDFDADGRSDLAVGVPGDNNGRGGVNVQYSPDAVLGDGAYFRQGLNLPGTASASSRAGSALACGDFDGDAFADLAIGVPGNGMSRGAVVVVYGSEAGLVNSRNTLMTQDTIGLGTIAPAEPGDRFGETLAAGDFDGDGKDDLAIGVPREDVPEPGPTPGGPPGDNVRLVGMVHIVFGESALGLAGPAQSFSPFTAGACCFEKSSALYGAALAVGDFNDDDVEDLAIGAPYADVNLGRGGVVAFTGAVHVLRGEAGTGLVLDSQLFLSEADVSASTGPRKNELFGWSLAAGQFDGQHGDDLAIGQPWEKLEGQFKDHEPGYGAVRVAFFDGAGLVQAHQFFTDSFGDGDRPGEGFGWAVAAGNFDGMHDDDLAIGVPLNVSAADRGKASSGAVVVILSDGFALGPAAQSFYPGDVADAVQTPPAPEGVEYRFGRSLAVGDYQGDGVADLFIGVPGLTLSAPGIGGVEIRPGIAGVGLGPSLLLLTQDTFQAGQTWHASASTAGLEFGFTDPAFTSWGEVMGYALGR